MATKEDAQAVGARIRAIRNNLGLTMSEFAAMIDSTAKSGTVSNWENGKNAPNLRRLKRIAELGGVDTNFLLNGLSIKQKRKARNAAVHDKKLSPKEEAALIIEVNAVVRKADELTDEHKLIDSTLEEGARELPFDLVMILASLIRLYNNPNFKADGKATMLALTGSLDGTLKGKYSDKQIDKYINELIPELKSLYRQGKPSNHSANDSNK
ncbi:helix-turn-helix domain-containing protein [Loigolactobacillus bifermentans]|uniref:HTH cro/C1-type domain-containing protein n=1 Tax=Loigolactobacillus bifermentans DSM 20003 TaxID=1423726 RepID=A0A0R1H2Y9_9LACO|nr:helix-turn-helix transcriptional regulator [Loigolactobacillus bifermentans]KRK40393.1 hypothetical protein FC07_GL000952 [Loigolactobacillus bifermentans DSM 20003]